MNNSAIEPLVDSIRTKLLADTTFKALCPNVFRTAPNSLVWPYLELTNCTEGRPTWDPMGLKGHELTVTLNIFARNADDVNITSLQIGNDAARVLCPATLTVAGYTHIYTLLEWNSPVADLTGTNKIVNVQSRYRIGLMEV